MADLHTIAISTLKGVGPRTAELLKKLNLHTLQDLLLHLPLRYQDRTKVTPIHSVRPKEHYLIEGVIEQGQIIYRRRRSLVCRIKDETGTITLHLFYFTQSQQQQLTTSGLRIRCFGLVRQQKSFELEMIHPEYKIIREGEIVEPEKYLTPIYPTVEGLSQHLLHKLIKQALLLSKTRNFKELLPESFYQKSIWPTLQEAITSLHQMPKEVLSIEAEQRHLKRRIALEELLAQQLTVQKYQWQVKQDQAVLFPGEQLQIALKRSLPFALTAAQNRVIAEINADLVQPKPMMRLLQGDVGCGKTLVAMMSVLKAVEAGYQAAVMAPTELLAEQHLQTFKRWLEPLSIKIGWLSSQVTQSVRNETLKNIAAGDYNVVIGTHALFQADIIFSKLAFIVIDEQHRFGVHQRLALKEKGSKNQFHPHQLVMTATPIPRTLAMTAYADLDVSIIDELPPGRRPVKTSLVSNEQREILMRRIQENCQQGRQAYWVCTLISESEMLQCEAAEATYELLKSLLKKIRIGLIHGQLKKEEKEVTMRAFKEGKIDLLVATTVIEVGVDVPNASLMVIENPERLGLAQLHQLRGRVGRGSAESYCVLLYQKPLTQLAKKRLMILRDSQDGFWIAEKDLEIRGPGEWLGVRQAGLAMLRIADLIQDEDLLPEVKNLATTILQQYPGLVAPLIERWFASAERYAGV